MDRYPTLVVTLLILLVSLAPTNFNFCIASPNGTCRGRERRALLTFKQGLVDPSNRLQSWTGENCCFWEGVGCDSMNGHVFMLNLSNPHNPYADYGAYEMSRLGGNISASLLELKHLSILSLYGNDFGGMRIPEFFGSLKHLRYLGLCSAGFAGAITPLLANLSRLQYLDIGGYDYELKVNDLEWIFHPSFTLQFLRLIRVDLSKSFNWLQVMNKLPFLSYLILSACRLDSIEPLPYVNFSSLIYLDLSLNNFTSSTLTQFPSLPSLCSLNLRHNLLSGIPLGLVNLTTLRNLDLAANAINSTIPEWLYDVTSLETLDISYNKFRGTISSAICKLSKIEVLVIWNNFLEGIISESHFSNLTSLREFDADSNKLTLQVNHSWIPPFQLNFLLMGCWQLGPQFPAWLQSQTSLVGLYLTNAGISDVIPSWFSSLSQISYLDLSNNQIHGTIPIHSFGKHTAVIRLESNNLTGKIPSSIGSLVQLWSLNLRKNKLSGNLPSSLQNCRNLKFMDIGENELSGSIPPWLGNSFPSLVVLILRSNKWSGIVPSQLCHLNSLQTLDLAHNNLSGTIPRCLSNFSAMLKRPNSFPYFFYKGRYFTDNTLLVMKDIQYEYSSILPQLTTIDLSCNSLSGEIPKELISLHGLISLNLSDNQIQGMIPKEIGIMRSLESLDLSMNRLSGEIPQSMTELTFLSYLNLSYNNFSGRIPQGTQMQSFTSLSFIGNCELCGSPLMNICSKVDAPPIPVPDDSDENKEDDGWMDMMWFYMGVPFGFVVGFWAVWGLLAFKRAWRYAYFQFLHDLMYKLFLYCL